jgi:hypothetical protein
MSDVWSNIHPIPHAEEDSSVGFPLVGVKIEKDEVAESAEGEESVSDGDITERFSCAGWEG